MSTDDEKLQKVGKYEIVRKIATGGMAELFLAKFSGPGGFEKRCALKQILPQFVGDEEFKRMFQNEARVAAMFDHPNLVQIFELDEDPESGRFYIAMELINGMDLRQLQNLAREQGQQIPPELAAWMISQTLDGLAYAHDFKDNEGTRLNLVHRDISPQNILVSYEGAIKVVDFGIVKASSNEGKTQTGMLKGKIAYMSPEQALGEKLDARSDLFAVGICLYELIAGVKPFRGANEIMTLRAILEQDAPPITNFIPDCPRGIERAINRALAKNRDERYQNAREFQVDLESVLRQTPMPIDRHMFSEFMKTLTECGTDRFDSTKLKIPRLSTAAELEPTPNPLHFAGSQPSVAPESQVAQAMAAEAAAKNVGTDAQVSPLASEPQGVTRPGVVAAEIQGGTDSAINSEVRAAGVGGNKMIVAVAGIAAVAIVIGLAFFFQGHGEIISEPVPPSIKPPPIVEKVEPVVEPIVEATPSPPTDAKDTDAKTALTGQNSPDSKTGVDQTTGKNVKPVLPVARPRPPVARPRPPVAKPKPVAIAKMGELSLSSVPRGLTVKVDGKVIGKTPLSAAAIAAGAHKVTVSSKAFGVYKSMNIQIVENKGTTRKVVFQRGTIRILSRPFASVSINGRSAGKTPLNRPMYEGRHEITLMTDDGREETRIIKIRGGQTEVLKVVFR
jgi:serine/threonine protein kinase